jgi:ferredoxin-NADP reductase
MSILKDILAMFKKRELRFIESYRESEQVHTFVFEKANDLTWNAGQYGLITITHKKIKNATKPFSLASAPAEKVVKLTTRIGETPSEYKKALLELKEGMSVSMQGPVGSFSLQDRSPALLIAGGIGITPFRSMLKQIEAEGNGSGRTVRLLHIDSDKTYLYREELEGIASRASIPATYVASRDDAQREIDEFAARHADGTYYIAGPKSMVESISTALLNQKISKRKIKKDAFFGY